MIRGGREQTRKKGEALVERTGWVLDGKKNCLCFKGGPLYEIREIINEVLAIETMLCRGRGIAMHQHVTHLAEVNKELN